MVREQHRQLGTISQLGDRQPPIKRAGTNWFSTTKTAIPQRRSLPPNGAAIRFSENYLTRKAQFRHLAPGHIRSKLGD
ncbi:hypothetical protein WH95_01450 [Kiloniella litopenaei]|uniref:Uncharacterized protein n=1 Tax=Kiloniella litopenaei TaxID=1549748 RepID=A0A0M2RGS2_9PROT|nr:hypothetical protein WH95_01450 [Kiloniella litopenaei]